MSARFRSPSACRNGLVALLLVGLVPSAPAAQSSQPAARAQPYVLRVEHDRVSVDAVDAPLVDIVTQIGKVMKFEVDARLPAEELVTLRFEALPLEQALARLSANHTLINDHKAGRIAKLILLPRGRSEPPVASHPPADGETPPPFEFSFDPSQVPETPGK